MGLWCITDAMQVEVFSEILPDLYINHHWIGRPVYIVNWYKNACATLNTEQMQKTKRVWYVWRYSVGIYAPASRKASQFPPI